MPPLGYKSNQTCPSATMRKQHTFVHRVRVSSNAADALAAQVTDEDRARGQIYPPFWKIRTISAHIARAVAQKSYEAGERSLERGIGCFPGRRMGVLDLIVVSLVRGRGTVAGTCFFLTGRCSFSHDQEVRRIRGWRLISLVQAFCPLKGW